MRYLLNDVTFFGIAKLHQPSLSHHMRRYREYLECKYESLELTSIDEKLNGSALEYINLTLVKVDEQGRHLSEEDKRSDTVTLSEALDVEGEKKKVILIKGDPGMGKTTLAMNICKRWAEGSLLQSYDAVILLPLRDPEIQKAKTIGDLLLTPDADLREHLLKEITKKFGEKICFIFEGHDELPEILYNSSIFTKLKEMLPKSTLIYTSRPEACNKVSNPLRVIKIEGFKKETVDEYISKTFKHVKDGQELSSQLKSQIHTNAIVRGLLHVPINVAIVCMIFFHCSMLPETYTQLYTLLCIRLILRHITTRTANVTKVEELHSLDDLPKDITEQFSQLCFIAYKGVESDELIFSSHELKSFDVVINKTNNLGLLVTAPSTSLYGTEKSYNFLHKTVQEFCATWYISKILSPQDRLKCINTNWDNGRYHMVLMFYSGITGLKNMELINCILPCMSVKSHYTERRTRDLLQYVYEAQNSEVCQVVGNHLCGNIDIYPSVLMIHAINYFLTQYNGEVGIIIDEFGLYELWKIFKDSKQLSLHNSIKLILQIMTSSRSIAHQLLLLDLLQRQFPVDELHINSLSFNKLQSDVHFLSKIFTSSNTLCILDISTFDINTTDIKPEVLTSLANLRNVKLHHLRMEDCHLGPMGADKLGEMLYHNNSITSVDLSSNNIGDDGVERLVNHLSAKNKLQHLNLSGNNITVVGAGHLRRLIIDHPTLTSIELSYNPLRNEGAHVILSSLKVGMEYIGLKGVDMTSSSGHIIAATLHKVKSISFDLLDDCEGICDSLANTTLLKKLELGKVSASINYNYFSAIRHNDSIEKLQLDDVTYECVTNIAKLLEHTQKLTEIIIKMKGWRQSSSSQVVLLLANTLTVNNSVKILKYCDWSVEQATMLKFLEQLKQANTIEEITFGVSLKVYYDYQFIQNVEMIVQQINQIRSTRGVSNLLKVMIVNKRKF